jgi:hypothetical protein
MAGYSPTPLGRKLGFTPGAPLWARDMPEAVKAALAADIGPRLIARPAKGLAAAHVFHTEAGKLKADLHSLREKLAPDGMVWVSWPKKAAKLQTDITEDVVRALALPLGFVDVKVCAVDETWSGLKLVVRRALR